MPRRSSCHNFPAIALRLRRAVARKTLRCHTGSGRMIAGYPVMAHVLMVKDLEPLDVESLKRAFRVSPALTDIDAQAAAHESFGLLLKGLDEIPARVLQKALAHEGIETALVPQPELPTVPPPHVIRQIDFLPTHLVLFDPLKRRIEVSWNDIMLIAAGNVRLQELKRVKMSGDEPHFVGTNVLHDATSGTRSKEGSSYHLLLELVVTGATARYEITADDFAFDCLGTEMQMGLEDNFRALVRGIESFAPYASLNRGAFQLCKENDDIFTYSSKMAFADEMIWMLWRIDQAAKAAQTASEDMAEAESP